MKKSFPFITFILLFFCSEMSAQTGCVPLALAVADITLNCTGGTTNRTGIAYNPNDSLYYSVNAGSSSYPIETFTATGGASVFSTSCGFDYRGLWWNPNTNQCEGNGYNTGGILTQNLNGTTGYAMTGGTTIFSGNNQPNNQSCGDYDYHANEIIYYQSNSIYRYNRVNNASLGNYALTGTPAGTNLNNYTVVYTGCLGMEIGVYDYTNKRLMLYDKSNGSYTANVPLPANAPSQSSYKVSYSNDLFWIYDGSGTWLSYQIFQGCLGPTATMTAQSDTTFCSGDSVVLVAGTDTAYSYQWQLNGNDISGASDTTFVAAASGNYAVEVSVAGGCATTSQAKMITVNPLPAAVVTAAGPTTVCSGDPVNLAANTGPGISWQWQLNSNDIAGETDSTYTATTSGNYGVVTTDTNTCAAISAGVTVTVWALPVPGLSADGPTEFCEGESVNLTGSGGSTYQWLNNGQPILGAGNAMLNVSSSGTYSVVVTDSNGCADTSISQLVTALPNPVVTVSGSNDTLYATPGFVSYQWLDAGGNPITGETNDYFVAPASGTYSVMVTDGNGCTSTSPQVVVVIVVGLEESLENWGLKIYPVPAHEALFVEMEVRKNADLKIIDLMGKVVFNQSVDPSNWVSPQRLELSGYNSGIYFLEIKSANEILRHKIVIQ